MAVVVAVALAAAGCSLPGGTRGGLHLTAVFDDVGDLVVNHSVQTADVRIGSITKIELTEDYKAKVTMSVQDVHLPKASTAVLRTTSLLGEKFIEIRADGDPTKGPFLADGDTLNKTEQAPELEFVAEQAVDLLASVVANDVATLVNTGAVGFGGRGDELRSLLDELTTVSGTLASQTSNILAIIDGLDQATSTLVAGNADIDQLLVNLSQTTTVLAQNRDQAVETVRQLTRLATVHNQAVFEPYLDDVSRQVKQLAAIVAEVTAGRSEVALLVDWLDKFIYAAPLGVPGDFAQIYGWFCSPGTC